MDQHNLPAGLTPEQLAAIVSSVVAAVQAAPQQALVNHTVAEPPSFPKRNKEFTSLGVSKFYGDGPAEKAYEWLEEMECHFGKVKPSETEKTLLGAQQLKSRGLSWWNTVRALRETDDLEWSDFKKMFLAEFVPAATRSALLDSFLHLRQDSRTVEKYHQQFKDLSRYGPELVNTNERQVERFIAGLSPDIKVQMSSSYNLKMVDVFNNALRAERSIAEQKASRQMYAGESSRSAGPRKDQGRRGRFQDRRRDGRGRAYNPYPRDQRAQAAAAPAQQNPAQPARFALPAPVAMQQGVEQRLCFNCNAPGHISRYCPQPRTRAQPVPARGRGGDRGRGRGRGQQQQRQQGARAYAALGDQHYLEEPQLPEGAEMQIEQQDPPVV